MENYISLIVTSLVSIAVGWFAHALTTRREREASHEAKANSRDDRMRDFVVFLKKWQWAVGYEYRPDHLANDYSRMRSAFYNRKAMVERDVPRKDRSEFNLLSKEIYRIPESKMRERNSEGTATGREELSKAIDALIRLLDKNEARRAAKETSTSG